MHYDGLTWQYYPEIQQIGTGILYSVDVHEDFMFAAGYTRLNDGTLRGIVVRGYKQ